MNERPTHPLVTRLDDDGFYAGDPFATYAELRAESPLVWNADKGYWAVTTHAEVLTVSRDPARFCSGKGILALEIGVEYPSPPTMMHTDPPDHSRYRKLVQPAFGPSATRAIEPVVRQHVADLVDRLPMGEAVDVVEHLSAPLPLLVIAKLLGIPDDDWHRFLRWSDASIPDAGGFTPEERVTLMEEMRQYLLTATRDRRGAPAGDDVISVLANVEVDGESLTDDELVMFNNQLLVAGNETSRNLISGALFALAERPNQWRRLRDDRSLVPLAVEESLRWTTPVIAFMRTATGDCELVGVAVAEGDPLVLVYQAANRDPAVFGPTAGEFDVARAPNPQLAFGFGAHFCIGAALARLEMATVLEALLDRFEALEPAGDLERVPSGIIAGIRHAPLQLVAA